MPAVSLMKAVVITSGIIHEGESVPQLCISAGVKGIPKGSGLGTSSVLILAVIKAIHGLYGVRRKVPRNV